MTSTPYVVRARRASRVIVGTALAVGRLPAGARTPLVLGALALGMPHGASDTELLRVAAAGNRGRHAGLVAAYAGLAGVGAALVSRGGPIVGKAVLIGSAAHFAEGELATWPASRSRADTALRLVGAALATTLLPAMVAGSPGDDGATARPGARAGGPGGIASSATTGLALLRTPGPSRRGVVVATAGALAATAALAVRRDPVAADLALLTALDLVTPPAVTFAAYFGGWHALRHTARVADALADAHELRPDAPLALAGWELARRSAWAAGVGTVGAAVLAARDPSRAADRALVAVLGLTLPHAATVALRLRPRRALPFAG